MGKPGHRSPTHAELKLERADFEQVTRELSFARPGVEREVAQARAIWPELARGLRSARSASLRVKVAAASEQAGRLPQPGFLAAAERLTGPAWGMADLYEHFVRLAERGWRLSATTIDSIANGPPANARFARENSSLYIYAIYDAHFDLSLLGKSIDDGYKHLGGEHVFGTKLPQTEIDRLSAAYSIPAIRLTPHPASSINLP